MYAVLKWVLLGVLFCGGHPYLNAAETEPNDPPAPENRKHNRPAELWQYYMYGMVDYFAEPVAIEALFGPDQDRSKWLVKGHPIHNPYKQSEAPALMLQGTSEFMSGNPLPIKMEKVHGRTVRIYFWEKGIEAGREESLNSWGDPPDVYIYIKNAENETVSFKFLHLGTQGTFPWHCYYGETFVPKTAAGIYLKFLNRHGDRVFFSNLSWEIVTKENALDELNEKQDPVTGSLAYNPYYDDYNFSLIYGRADRYKWNFWKGVNGGLKGNQYDIRTRAGLRKYFTEKVLIDADHMNHGVMYLADRYNWGKQRNVLPDGMEDGWLECLAELVIGAQDPDTGYWGTKGFPLSMGMTFHITEGLFDYYGVEHPDRPSRERNSIRHMGIKEIPLADKIVETTLNMQAGYIDEDGVERKAGWPRHAYNFTENPNSEKQRGSLIVCANAMWMMRRMERFVQPPLQQKIYDSSKAAIRYILRKCVLDSGLYLQSDTDREITSGEYFMEWILDHTNYLERKIVENIPEPEMTARKQNDVLIIEWGNPLPEQNCVRVYAASKHRKGADLNESDLVGIIHRTGHRIYEMDPLLVARKISIASKEHWGKGFEKQEGYLGWKINVLTPQNLAVVKDAAPLEIPIEDMENKKIYVSAANWYGEESNPVLLYNESL